MHTQIHNRHTYTQTLRQINYTDIKMNMKNRNEKKQDLPGLFIFLFGRFLVDMCDCERCVLLCALPIQTQVQS